MACGHGEAGGGGSFRAWGAYGSQRVAFGRWGGRLTAPMSFRVRHVLVRGARTVPAGRRLARNIFVFGLLWSVRMCLCLFYT